MVCLHRQRGEELSQCGQGEMGSIFCDLVQTSFMDGPLVIDFIKFFNFFHLYVFYTSLLFLLLCYIMLLSIFFFILNLTTQKLWLK